MEEIQTGVLFQLGCSFWRYSARHKEIKCFIRHLHRETVIFSALISMLHFTENAFLDLRN